MIGTTSVSAPEFTFFSVTTVIKIQLVHLIFNITKKRKKEKKEKQVKYLQYSEYVSNDLAQAAFSKQIKTLQLQAADKIWGL